MLNTKIINQVYSLMEEILENCPDEDECSDFENEFYDEVANLKQVINNNKKAIEEIKDDEERDNSLNEDKLVKAINIAFSRGHEVFFNNYQSWDREDGTPTNYDVNGDEDDEFEIDCLHDLDIPDHDRGGCNDLVIHDVANDDYYYVWYEDDEEEVVYIDAVEKYLELYTED